MLVDGRRRSTAGGSTQSGPTYVVPRSDAVVVGGTDEDGDWSRTPSPETAADDPGARHPAGARRWPAPGSSRHRVGLRPVRPEVRLEAEGRVVHCYGHGGAGVTLSWGCADEVTRLVGELTLGVEAS